MPARHPEPPEQHPFATDGFVAATEADDSTSRLVVRVVEVPNTANALETFFGEIDGLTATAVSWL